MNTAENGGGSRPSDSRGWRVVSKKHLLMHVFYSHNYKITCIVIHKFFQWVFANFCYWFHPCFVHRPVFSQGFSQVRLKKFSQKLLIGFFTGFFTGVSWAIFSNFVHRFFHRVFHRCFLRNFLKNCS